MLKKQEFVNISEAMLPYFKMDTFIHMLVCSYTCGLRIVRKRNYFFIGLLVWIFMEIIVVITVKEDTDNADKT